MSYKSFIIGLIVIVFGLSIFLLYQYGYIKTEKLVPINTNNDSSFCRIDTECRTYCDFSKENTGRGKCFNKEFIMGKKKDVGLNICAQEYEAECNSCICETGQCTTIGTGDFLC